MNKFVLLVLSAASVFAQQLVLVSGQGQVAPEQFPAPRPMIVRAVDAAGRPAAGVPVSWTITQGMGTIRNAETATDAEGLARAGFQATSVQPGGSYLQTVVTASGPSGSVPFYITTTQSVGSSLGQPIIEVQSPQPVRAQAGAIVPEAVIVYVAASSGALQGQGIPNVGVRITPSVNPDSPSPTAACDAPGGVVLTDQRGRAACNLVLGPVPGINSFRVVVGELSSSREISFEVTPGQACSVILNPSTLNFGASGGTATFQVSAVNCAWTATAAATWLSFDTNASGTGPGQVTVRVEPNPGSARSTLISVGNATLSVTQSAAGMNVPLSFATGQNLPQATAGLAYLANIVVSGGQPAYTWTATGLPAGLSLGQSTGTLTGTVAAAGTYSIPVTVRDAAGTTISQTFTLVVTASQNPGGGLEFTTQSLPAAALNTAYSQLITATGGCPNPFFGPPRLEIVQGSLPPGLRSQSGPAGGGLVISGTPTQRGTYTFAIRASDACGAFITRQFTLQVSGQSTVPLISSSALALNFTVQRGSGRSPEQAFTISAGQASIPFTASAMSDSNWLSVSPTAGTTTETLTARVNNVDLLPGTYTGSVTIVSETPNSPLTIPATLTVTGSASLAVTPTALTFEFEPGGIAPATQTISVTTPGAILPITVTAQTSSGGNWLTFTQSSATSPAFVTVLANPVGLAAGTYSGSVTITPAFNIAPVTVPVTVSVASRTGPTVLSTANGASFLPDPASPGQIRTIFGRDMGPATLTQFRLTPDGRIATELADVRVLFDGLPAPLLYVSSTQTTVVVPYTVAGRPNTRMEVEYRGVRSAPVEIPVAPSAPGLFTIGGGPQGAILNQDGTVNGAQNGAQPGTIVSLFATGEGLTIPPSIAGTVVPPTALARPVLPVTVTIGGREAEVLYAGSAPGQPAGLVQVNARIPLATPVGSPVPVVVTVGSESSQPGVTVFVDR